MKQIKIVFQFIYFFLVSVPLACIVYVTAISIFGIKSLLNFKKQTNG